MGFKVHGDYFEACNCEVSCPCIFLAPASNPTCDLVLAWHIAERKKEDLDLGGLNVVMAVRSPQQRTDGKWRAALYIDERASADQQAALGDIFSGKAGGHLANVAPLIGEVTGVHAVPIRFDKANGTRRLQMGGLLDVEIEQLKGMDGTSPIEISNPLLGAVTQTLRQAKSDHLRYDGPWSIDVSGRNGFIADFAYEA